MVELLICLNVEKFSSLGIKKENRLYAASILRQACPEPRLIGEGFSMTVEGIQYFVILGNHLYMPQLDKTFYY